MRRLVALSLLAVTLLAPSARADVIIKMQKTDFTAKTPEVASGTIWLTPENMALQWANPKKEARDSHIIYRGDKDALWILQDADKKYTEMTKESMAAMGSQISDAMAQMKATLDKLPPEQRKMVEESMAKAKGGGDPGDKKSTREVKKTTEKKTINGFPTVKYEVYEQGKLATEVWTTPYDKFGVKPGDMQAMNDMSKMFEGLTSKFKSGKSSDAGGGSMFGGAGIDGVPILTRDLDEKGKPTTETEFQSVTHDKVDPVVMELPDGYTKSDFMGKKKP